MKKRANGPFVSYSFTKVHSYISVIYFAGTGVQNKNKLYLPMGHCQLNILFMKLWLLGIALQVPE